jgi:hypothetical protein
VIVKSCNEDLSATWRALSSGRLVARPRVSGRVGGIGFWVCLFGIGAAVLGGISGIQKFVTSSPYFTYGHLLLITAPLCIATAILAGSWAFHRYEITAIQGVFIFLGGAVVGVLLNLTGHTVLEQALTGKIVCAPQSPSGFAGYCNPEVQGAPAGIPGAVFNVIRAYWKVYGPANFALAIAGGILLAGLFTGAIKVFRD